MALVTSELESLKSADAILDDAHEDFKKCQMFAPDSL
jgi:hypothetical protein